MSIGFPSSAACALLSVPQAGGGGLFSGGDAPDIGGDHGWILEVLYWLVRLALSYPMVGVPLLAGFVVLVLVGLRKGWWKHQERTIRRARDWRTAHASALVASRLRASDPLFDESRFLARVQRAFRRAQDAWCAQDLEPLRAFVSDGVFERFALQVEEQRADGWRQGIRGLSVSPLTLVHVHVGRVFESITVRIPFRAVIQRLDLASGKPVPGSALPREFFTELWSFVRRRGTRTLSGEGLIEGKCPNCAAPLALKRSARCEHCAALVRSGQFDWVLAEITQASEWRAEDEDVLPGFEAYRALDPGMNAQMLEDRASVAFWRTRAAERSGRVEPLVRVADEALCRRLASELARPSRTLYADCAVGSVRTLGILSGPERDRALLEIVWDGRPVALGADGQARAGAARRITRSLFVFARMTDQVTRLEEAFSTTHCRTCGAHDTGGTAPTCPYCDAPQNGGPAEWLLAQVWPAGSVEALTLREELREAGRALAAGPPPIPRRSAGELVAWASALAHADGTLDAREGPAVQALARRAGVPMARVEEWLAAPKEEGLLAAPGEEPEARVWFHELTRIALADGKLSADERRFLERTAGRIGLTRHDFAHLFTNVRAALYREARAARSGHRAAAGNEGA